MTKHKFLIFVVLILWPYDLLGQERGLPKYLRSYDSEELPASRAYWSILQAQNGKMYFGNSQGIIVHDGGTWNLVELPNAAPVRSLAQDDSGRILVGAYNDFGQLKISKDGREYFESFVNGQDDEIGDVWYTHVLEDKVIFQSNSALYVWDGQQIKTLRSIAGIHTSFVVDGSLWIREWGVGLSQLVGDNLELVPGGDLFADIRVYSVLSFNGQTIVAARERGVYSFDGNGFQEVSGEVSRYLIENQVYSGATFNDTEVAFATLKGGVVTTKDLESINWRFSSDNSISDRVVNYVRWDSEGGLWIALHNGELARIDVPPKKTHFDKQLGSEGNIAAVSRFQGKMVVASGAGVQRIQAISNHYASYLERLTQFPIAKDLLRLDDEWMFIGTEEGLFTYDGTTSVKLTASSAQAISRSAARDGVWVGTPDGLIHFAEGPEGWTETSMADVTDDVRSIVDSDNRLWLGLRNNGLMHLHLSDSTVAKFDTSHGLPVGTPQVELISGQPAFVFEDGFFRFDSLSSTFYIDSTSVPNLTSDSNALLDVFEDHEGNVWSVFTNDVYVARPVEKNSYSITRHPDLSFRRENVSQIYVEDSGLVWISSGNELVRYDPSIDKSYDIKYPPIIRRVTASRTDSVVFYGATMPGVPVQVPSLHYSENDLHIEFSVPEFNAPEKTQYSFKLEGRGDEWSQWSTKSAIDFNNLREGEYRFVIKAKNSMGYVSPEGSYSFVILPPWYRTWWSFLLFALLFLSFAYFSLKYYLMAVANRRAQEQARELARERVVNEKLQEANDQLQTANERLKEVNSLKDEFLATTSHELRTPLTAILGYAAILKEEITGPQREFVEIIEQSSNRLMHTLNSVLDLAKLRSGTTDLRPVRLDLAQKAMDLATAYKDIAASQGLNLECSIPKSPVPICADEYAVATIIDSLLDNAIKFTHNGSVRINVAANQQNATLTISDDGVGMDPDFLPKIFDEFRQESDGLARTHNGNGLGLSIVAKMIELLEGSIEVTSEKGVGSEFIVTLKLDPEPTESPSQPADRPPTANTSNSDRHPRTWVGKKDQMD